TLSRVSCFTLLPYTNALPIFLLGPVGCVGGAPVVRVYDGQIVKGRWIPPEAYAAFLRGALAEESGDLRGALAAYERAASEDDGRSEEHTSELQSRENRVCRLL